MMIEERVLKNWLDLVKIANKLDVGPINKVNYLFRGHSVSSWELKSSFHRIADVKELSPSDMIEIEQEALSKFKAQADQFLPYHVVNKTKDILGWWTLMQHYGAPTRLLDWTLSPFVAAYNACIENFDKPGAIWVC